MIISKNYDTDLFSLLKNLHQTKKNNFCLYAQLPFTPRELKSTDNNTTWLFFYFFRAEGEILSTERK